MNFDDTPQEAAFRAEVRGWLDANLPKDLLADAMKVTKKGITETLVEGLRQVRRQSAYEAAMALKGKIKLDVDLEESRERRRR